MVEDPALGGDRSFVNIIEACWPSLLELEDVGETARLKALVEVANFSGVVLPPGGYIGVNVEMGDNDLDTEEDVDVVGLASSC